MCLKNIRYFILDYNWDVFLIIAINFREILRNHRIPIAFFITILNSLILLRLLNIYQIINKIAMFSTLNLYISFWVLITFMEKINIFVNKILEFIPKN